MIIPVEMYTAQCDNCGVHCEFGEYSCYGDKSIVREQAEECRWYFTDYEKGKCYCENCWEHDDNDEIIIKPKP